MDLFESVDLKTDWDLDLDPGRPKLSQKKKKQRNLIFKELSVGLEFLLEPEVLCRGLRDTVPYSI